MKEPYPKERWTKLLKDVVEILEAPKGRKEVLEEAKKRGYMGEKTVDRMLKALKEANLIKERKDGRYEWVGIYERFADGEGYRQRLKHSQSIIAVIKTNLRREAILYGKDFSYFEKHLNHGYPEDYELYEKWKSVYFAREKTEKGFRDELETLIQKKGFEIKAYHSITGEREVTTKIFDIIEEGLRLNREGIKNYFDLEVTEEGIIKDGTVFCRNKDVLEEIQKLFRNCVQSESIKNLYMQLLNIKDEELRIFSELIGRINYLAMSVLEDGYPLKGHCERCQRKIIIERKS